MIEVEQDRKRPKRELEYTHDAPLYTSVKRALKAIHPGLYARHNKRSNRWEIWRTFVNDRPDTRLLRVLPGQPIDKRTYDILRRGMWLAKVRTTDFLAEIDKSNDYAEIRVDKDYEEAVYQARDSLRRWY